MKLKEETEEESNVFPSLTIRLMTDILIKEINNRKV
jgi:hypothetical protein